MAGIEIVACNGRLSLLCDRPVGELGDDTRFRDADKLDALAFHLIFQCRGRRIGKIVRIPGEFAVVVAAVVLPVVVNAVAVKRNALGAVGVDHCVKLGLIDAPFIV